MAVRGQAGAECLHVRPILLSRTEPTEARSRELAVILAQAQVELEHRHRCGAAVETLTTYRALRMAHWPGYPDEPRPPASETPR